MKLLLTDQDRAAGSFTLSPTLNFRKPKNNSIPENVFKYDTKDEFLNDLMCLHYSADKDTSMKWIKELIEHMGYNQDEPFEVEMVSPQTK